jgi:hypothetical protein
MWSNLGEAVTGCSFQNQSSIHAPIKHELTYLPENLETHLHATLSLIKEHLKPARNSWAYVFCSRLDCRSVFSIYGCSQGCHFRHRKTIEVKMSKWIKIGKKE